MMGGVFTNKKMNYLHYRRLSRLTEAKDNNGERVPFKVLYAAKNGDVITPESGECVVTSIDIHNGTRTVQFLQSGQSRTLRDCLFLSVFLRNKEYKLIAN